MKTKDLGFAATAVLKGYRWIKIEEVGGRVEIQFPDTAALHALRDEYSQDRVQVAPRAFWAMLKTLKSRAQDQMGLEHPPQKNAMEGAKPPCPAPSMKT